MQNLNHHGWGRIRRINRKAAWIGLCAVVLGMLSMLVVSAAHDVTVYHNNSCQVVSAYSDNPHDIMKKVGIDSESTNEYELEETSEGLVLRVSPECSISVTADGTTYQTVSRTDRVANILKALHIQVGENDLVTPSLDTIFTEDCNITVQRVAYQTSVRQESIEPGTVYEDTDTLPTGTTAVKTKGIAGTKQVTYEDKLIDGEISESTALQTVVLETAADEILLRGTAPAEKFNTVVTTNASLNKKMVSPLEPEQPIAVNGEGKPLTYKKCITGKATAYTASEGKHTATGEEAQLGYIAVDPNEIPYGTMMYIKTADGSYFYGLAKAADTGGFTSGSVAVDLFFETEAECIQFGVRDVEIYIL